VSVDHVRVEGPQDVGQIPSPRHDVRAAPGKAPYPHAVVGTTRTRREGHDVYVVPAASLRMRQTGYLRLDATDPRQEAVRDVDHSHRGPGSGDRTGELFTSANGVHENDARP
jgi:hypothetical protein